MGSPQTLALEDRRVLAAWAADCAGRALWLFESEVAGDGRPRGVDERARAFARGAVPVVVAIRKRLRRLGGEPARGLGTRRGDVTGT